MQEAASWRGTLGLAYWSDAVFAHGGANEEAFALMYAQPRFLEACIATVDGTLRMIAADPIMARALKDTSRLFYAVFALYLDARGGMTATSIREFCEEVGLASPGRATAILLHLHILGYIRMDRSHTDRRVRHYVPTPAMRNAIQQIQHNELLGLSLIEPEAGKFAARLADPEIFKPFLLTMGHGMTNVVRRPESVVKMFADRNAGIAMLYRIARSGAEGDTYPPRGPVRIVVSDLAREFEVSRSHVLNVLREAQKQGLIRRDPETLTGYLEEKLREGLLRFQAGLFIGFAGCAFQALKAVGEAG